MAAYQYGRDVKKTDRYRLGELLAEQADHLLFLTATPHKGDPDNFRLLLSLLDQDLYANVDVLWVAVRQGETPVFLRRMKEDMVASDGKPLFPPRHANTVGYRLSRLERALYDAVTDYVQDHYQRRRRQGEDMVRAIDEAHKRRDQLIHRRDQRLAELEQERHLSRRPPEVVAVALVVPGPAGIDPSVAAAMHRDDEVEQIAMQVAMEYERGHNRVPEDVAAENLGFDIRSSGGTEIRYIEVKGRAASGSVALTRNEWIKAERFGLEYWLYVVVDCKTKPELYVIQDPAARIQPDEVLEVVRYVVPPDVWRRVAEAVS